VHDKEVILLRVYFILSHKGNASISYLIVNIKSRLTLLDIRQTIVNNEHMSRNMPDKQQL